MKTKTLCLDGHSGIDSAEAGSLPTNPRADPARLHSAAQKKTQETPVQLILGHYTRMLAFCNANPAFHRNAPSPSLRNWGAGEQADSNKRLRSYSLCWQRS